MQATLFVAVLVAALPVIAQNRSPNPNDRAENLAACGLLGIRAEPNSAFGFAKSTLVSLWYAKLAAERGAGIQQATKDADNMFTFATAVMRIGKEATNDYLCARRALAPFADSQTENIKAAARFFRIIYDQHIELNHKMNELMKKLSTAEPGELMDQISTLQVERTKLWTELNQPTVLALTGLIDLKRTDDPNKTTRLTITKAEKESLLTWVGENFPEFKNGTSKDKWMEAAKTAELLFTVFQGRKCADE